jgi:hypothetical protein
MTNCSRVTCMVLGGVLTLAAACSSSDKAGVFTPTGGSGGSPGGTGNHAGGKSGSAGKGGSVGAAGESGSAGVEEQGGQAGATDTPSTPRPVVTVTSPSAVSDPNVGPVLVGDQASYPVTVLCTAHASVEPNAQPLKNDSVTISLLDSSGVAQHVAKASPTANAGEFSATFDLGAGPMSDAPTSGKISFECSASDTATPASVGTGTVSTLLDHGPTITVFHPAVASKNPLTQLGVDFSVTPTLLATGDAQADISAVTLSLDGINQTLPTADVNGHYTLTVDLTDRTLFPVPPTGAGVSIVITAANKRKPKSATANDTYQVVIDGTPPVAVITSPAADSVVGNDITLKFSVSDDLTGVVPTSVYVLLNQQKYFYPGTDTAGWTKDGANNFTFTFPSNYIPDPKVQGSPSVWATDGAGNASGGVSINFYLDTTPPLVDLDPKPLRERTTVASVSSCSDPFDPLGGAANDQSTVLDAARFRAFVWDQTNTQLNLDPTQYHYAKIDPTSVVVYALLNDPAAPVPLLKSSTGSGKCDTLNITAAKVQTLNPITPAGTPNFTTDSANAIAGICGVKTSAGSAALCDGSSDLSVALEHVGPNGLADPAIFGSGGLCTGNQWILPNAVASKDGWLCLVAKATDKVGNVGFSRPLRVCLDAADANGTGFVGTPACTDPNTSPPPSCTDGCTVPPQVDLTYVDE